MRNNDESSGMTDARIRNTKELHSNNCENRRQLYCAQDSAVTMDVWNNIQLQLKENNLYDYLKEFTTSVMKNSSNFKFDENLIKKSIPKVPTKRLPYSKILREKNILKESEEWKPWKLDRNYNHGSSVEKRAICSQLLDNRSKVELEKCLNSLLGQTDFIFFLDSYVIKLRTPSYEKDVFLPENISLRDLKKYSKSTKLKTFNLNHENLVINNEDESIVEHWLLGTSSSHISRYTNLKTNEIDEKFWKLHLKNKWRYELMQDLFQQLSDNNGTVKNPLTGSKFTLLQNASEQELMSLIFEEKRLIEICKFCSKLDRPFIAHKNQILYSQT